MFTRFRRCLTTIFFLLIAGTTFAQIIAIPAPTPVKVERQPAPQAAACLGLFKGEVVVEIVVPKTTAGIDLLTTPPPAIRGYCIADSIFKRVEFREGTSRPEWGSRLWCPVSAWIPERVGDHLCTHQEQSTKSNKVVHDLLDAAAKRIGELEVLVKRLEAELKTHISNGG